VPGALLLRPGTPFALDSPPSGQAAFRRADGGGGSAREAFDSSIRGDARPAPVRTPTDPARLRAALIPARTRRCLLLIADRGNSSDRSGSDRAADVALLSGLGPRETGWSRFQGRCRVEPNGTRAFPPPTDGATDAAVTAAPRRFHWAMFAPDFGNQANAWTLSHHTRIGRDLLEFSSERFDELPAVFVRVSCSPSTRARDLPGESGPEWKRWEPGRGEV